jgi:pyrimidine deaminase RibD-like protein
MRNSSGDALPMDADDYKFMEKAFELASQCDPIKESIPKVGAVIAVDGEIIGAGRRGNGGSDDEHAEWNALGQVENKALLTNATLYTTLEPCTAEVRSRPLESCTELIHQHRIKRVVIGMLDPNQGVTGKGLWRLQDSGTDVSLFPHDLAEKVRAINAPFIRSQQSLRAQIISPQNGEVLPQMGNHPIRFKCAAKPSDHDFVLVMKDGLCLPQSSVFRQDEDDYVVDAHFGMTGEHTVYLVTANDLGVILIGYYRRILARNAERNKQLLLMLKEGQSVPIEGRWPGIPMPALPKGLRLEAWITVVIAED